MAKESRRGLLSNIDTRTQVLALITLIAEALFIGSLVAIPSQHIIWAMVICAGILIMSIVGIIIIEVTESRLTRHQRMRPSPLTPDSKILGELVNGAIQTVCRAVSVPQTPESAKLRVFMFRKEHDQLVCSHYWSPNPAKEVVGRLRFAIRTDLADRIAVVKSVVNGAIARTEVAPLSDDAEGVSGEIEKDLKFVLACPIYDADKSIWGVIDFDASTDDGRALLQTEVSDAVMFQLAKHIQVVFALADRAT